MAIPHGMRIDHEESMGEPPHVFGRPQQPEMITVRLADGRTLDVKRPKIIRSHRVDSMRLSPGVVRALGRLEARKRDLARKNRQLRLDLP